MDAAGRLFGFKISDWTDKILTAEIAEVAERKQILIWKTLRTLRLMSDF